LRALDGLAKRLASRTETRTPTCDANLLDRCAAAVAGLANAAVDVELVLHAARLTTRVAVVAERRTLSFDPTAEGSSDPTPELGHLGGPKVAGKSKRMDPREPERFVRVDVPDAGGRALVEEG
jgi:hypothetical protein